MLSKNHRRFPGGFFYANISISILILFQLNVLNVSTEGKSNTEITKRLGRGALFLRMSKCLFASDRFDNRDEDDCADQGNNEAVKVEPTYTAVSE